MNFVAVFVEDGAGLTAYAEEIAEVRVHGRTVEEARSELREALAVVLAANRYTTRDLFRGARVLHREPLATGVSSEP